MSLRPTSLRSLQSIRTPLRALPIRSLQTTPPRRADHSGHDHSNPNDRQYETRETWFAGPSRNFIIASLIAYFAWPYLPDTPDIVSSPASDPEGWAKLQEDPNVPWYTRWIAKQYTPREVVDKAVDEKTRQAAYTATGRMLMWESKGDALSSTQGRRPESNPS